MLISEIAKRVLPAGQSIACAPELVNYCGTYGGFPELAPNVITTVEGLYVNHLKEQGVLEATLPADVHVLGRYNVTMIIVGPESTSWNPRVATWLKDKELSLIGDVQGYDLYKTSPQTDRDPIGQRAAGAWKGDAVAQPGAGADTTDRTRARRVPPHAILGGLLQAQIRRPRTPAR